MALLGDLDLGSVLGAVQQGVGDLIGSFRPDTENAALAGMGQQQQQGSLFDDLSYGANPALAGLGNTGGNPALLGLGGTGFDPFGQQQSSAGAGLDWAIQGDPIWQGFDKATYAWGQQQAERAAAANKPPTATAPTGQPGTGTTGAAGAGLWLQGQRGDSPIVGIADDLAAYAESRGVDPGVVFGLLRKESQYGADGAMGIRQNNPGNIMAPGADPANGKIILRTYGSVLDGTKAIVDLLAGYGQTYGAKTLEDMIAIYYVGPEAYKRYGLDANDAGGSGPGGNGTVRDYLNQHIYPVVQSYNGRPQAQRPAGTTNAQGNAFPVVGFNGKVQLHHGSHNGAADIFAAAGTQVAAMTNGTVVSAGYDETGGYFVMIRSDDGTDEYYAHMLGQPPVKQGQRVNAGSLIGQVGETGNAKGTGAHLHVGKGYGIINGTGPAGGAGANFDFTGWLTGMLGGAAHFAGDGHAH